MPQRLRVQTVATAPGQALPPNQHHPGAGLQGQTRRQGHGVGGLAKKRRPLTHALGGHLVGQQTHGTPRTQGLDHLPHTRQRGGHGLQAWPLARQRHDFAQPGMAGGAVKHREGAVFGRKTQGQRLGRDFKATHVRGQKQHPLAAGIGLYRSPIVSPHHRWRAAQPQARQLGRHAPGLSYGPPHPTPPQTGLARVVQKTASVTP